MTFKNYRITYFGLHAVTIDANAPQDFRGYWTKVYQICSGANFFIDSVSALLSVHPLSNDRGDISKRK